MEFTTICPIDRLFHFVTYRRNTVNSMASSGSGPVPTLLKKSGRSALHQRLLAARFQPLCVAYATGGFGRTVGHHVARPMVSKSARTDAEPAARVGQSYSSYCLSALDGLERHFLDLANLCS